MSRYLVYGRFLDPEVRKVATEVFEAGHSVITASQFDDNPGAFAKYNVALCASVGEHDRLVKVGSPTSFHEVTKNLVRAALDAGKTIEIR